MGGFSKKHSAFYQYLEPFLESGNASVIKKAKAEWRKKYKADWRRNTRKENKEITVSWSQDEFRILKAESKRHRLSSTAFIKKTVMAYIDKRYIVPNQNAVNKILQLLALTYNSIEEMQNEQLLSYNTEKKLHSEISQLERDIRIAIFSPKTIEQLISESIKEKPVIKTRLKEFIETLA